MVEQKKILVVEDEGMIRRALVEKFSEESFQVISASNGLEGLEKALSERPDFILLDIVMPEMDGVTVSKKLDENPATKNIPILFLTNLSDSKDVREKITREEYEFLVKANWDISDVVEKVREKIAGE